MLGNYLEVLISLVQEHKITLKALISDTDISLSQLQNEVEMDELQFIQLFRKAFQLTQDASLGLRFGAGLNFNTHGAIGQLAMSCATIFDVLEVLMKYHPILMPSRLRLKMTKRKDRVALLCTGDHLTDMEEQFLVDSVYATVVTLLRFLANKQQLDIELELDYTAPSYHQMYDTIFDCPVSFSKNQRQMLIHSSTLSLPLLTANSATKAILLEQCDRLLLRGGKNSVANKVQEILLFYDTEFPDVKFVAEHLFMSERTLRRRLKEEATSYQKERDRVRYQLAGEYLHNTSLPISEVARLVGFSDAANFRRAFRRWSGRQPSALRTKELRGSE